MRTQSAPSRSRRRERRDCPARPRTWCRNHFKTRGLTVFLQSGFISPFYFRTFFENLGPIKVKRKGKKGGKKGEEDCSVGPPEDKVKFWLPTTPPSVRPEDIFVGKKFDKPQKQVTFSDQNNIF